jgi:ABC-type nitrate/sulfonate/bicarbonate transport system substrate-binding protein
MKKGEIDAISNLDPMMTKLEQEGDIKVVTDSRTEEGTRAIFGGSNPAAVLYAKTGLHRQESQHHAGARQCLPQDAPMARKGDA